jgi:hypothetical protein
LKDGLAIDNDAVATWNNRLELSVKEKSHQSTIELVQLQQLLAPHNVDNVNGLSVDAVEDSAWRNDELAIRQVSDLGWNRSDLRESRKHINLRKYAPYESSCCGWFVQRNVVGNRF